MKQALELKNGQKILFTGNSITDASRTQRVYRPLGFGYVHFVANMLRAGYPQLNLEFINTGVSGNTIRALSKRWRRDCIEHEPDILSVLIGVNDVWRGFEDGKEHLKVEVEEYTRIYRDMLSAAIEECDCRVVLAEPFMFCKDRENPMFSKLEEYIKAVREISAEFNATLVPLQAEINREITETPEEKWSQDMVHPYVWAHTWIARKWVESTGLMVVRTTKN